MSEAILTLKRLQRLAPGAKKDILQGLVEGQEILRKAGLMKSRRRLCYFLAQAAHETAGFRTLKEYGAKAYFKRRYGHRKDLGNKQASDGPRYRGRGIFQLTGRYNYRKFGRKIGVNLEKSPHLAARPEISIRIAVAYWKSHGLMKLADRKLFVALTRRINGGTNGLKSRRLYLRRAFKIWSHVDFPPDLDTQIVLGPLKMPRQISDSPSHQQQSKGVYNMNSWKSYLASRTLWAAIIGLVAMAMDVFGIAKIGAEDQQQIIDGILKLVEAGGFVAAALFRILAKDRLTLSVHEMP